MYNYYTITQLLSIKDFKIPFNLTQSLFCICSISLTLYIDYSPARQ